MSGNRPESQVRLIKMGLNAWGVQSRQLMFDFVDQISMYRDPGSVEYRETFGKFIAQGSEFQWCRVHNPGH